jgi:hypothetical protein
MSYDENLRCRTLDADASVGIYTGVPGMPGSAVPNGGKQYCAVKLTGTHQCGLAVAPGDAIVGVLQNKPQGPGHAATVAYEGVTRVVAGAAFAAGVLLMVDGQGRLILATAGNRAFLRAEAPAGGAGEIVPASFIPGGVVA